MAHYAHMLIFLFLACLTAAEPCTKPAQRKPWYMLANAEKLAYLDAELCLMKKPATLGLPGAKTRFDEFQALHQRQAYYNHFVGSFLPFHRLMLHTHEMALKNECNYTGYHPYWQEQRDAGNFRSSPVLDPTYGFGGDGSGPDSCITTGPFANYTNSLGPGYQITDHCINRAIDEALSSLTSQSTVDACLKRPDFTTAWPCMEGSPHTGGHAGIGAQMGNGVSSPGDPLFYMHHAWMDKMFWDWQKRDLPTRATEIGGTNIGQDYAPGFPPRPASIPFFFRFKYVVDPEVDRPCRKATGAPGDPGTTTTLNHILNMEGVGPSKTIADVMDIQGGFLCYEYVEG